MSLKPGKVEAAGVSTVAWLGNITDVFEHGFQEIKAISGNLNGKSHDRDRMIVSLEYEVNLHRVVLVVDAMFAGGVEVELPQLEGFAVPGHSTIGNNLERASEVQQFGAVPIVIDVEI